MTSPGISLPVKVPFMFFSMRKRRDFWYCIALFKWTLSAPHTDGNFMTWGAFPNRITCILWSWKKKWTIISIIPCFKWVGNASSTKQHNAQWILQISLKQKREDKTSLLTFFYPTKKSISQDFFVATTLPKMPVSTPVFFKKAKNSFFKKWKLSNRLSRRLLKGIRQVFLCRF